jgi:hypothetical protein
MIPEWRYFSLSPFLHFNGERVGVRGGNRF